LFIAEGVEEKLHIMLLPMGIADCGIGGGNALVYPEEAENYGRRKWRDQDLVDNGEENQGAFVKRRIIHRSCS